MAAQRKAIWDDHTWNAPADALVEKPPSQMFLVALKAQAETMREIATLTVDDIFDGLMAYETLAHLVRPPEELLMSRLAEKGGATR